MNSRDLIGILGWVTVVSFVIAMSNYFVKFINKKFINKLGKDKKQIVDVYRKIMKIIMKIHRLAGTIAVVSVLAHSFIAFSYGEIKITGTITALLMATIFILGFYGALINKNFKGKWLKVHRVLAFALIIAIGIHIL